MIANKKEFTGGIVLLALFFAVLIVMFQPLFDGKNAMAYLDSLYNSISKGSVYYIPAMRTEAEKLGDKTVDLKLEYGSEAQAEQSAALFTMPGVTVSRDGVALSVSGPLSAMLEAGLSDADFMYHNDGQAIEDKYNLDPRRVMFNWWTSMKLMDKVLKQQKEFTAAKVTTIIQAKAVETAYNYYKVEPQQISDRLGTVIFSLVFYVVYTLWYGFAILFAFEGWGLRLSH